MSAQDLCTTSPNSARCPRSVSMICVFCRITITPQGQQGPSLEDPSAERGAYPGDSRGSNGPAQTVEPANARELEAQHLVNRVEHAGDCLLAQACSQYLEARWHKD
jgi:hypothetical protein